MTITRRGKIVLVSLIVAAGVTLGAITADWMYYEPHSIARLGE